MRRPTNGLPAISLLAVLVLAAAGAMPAGEGRERPLAEAEIFLELNDTDGDLGLHASIDGEPWTTLAIEGPGDRTLLDIVSRGRVRDQGLTQLSFESAEPDFEELEPPRFFRRFPEGPYEIDARAKDGTELVGIAMLSHVLAARPGNVAVSGVPAAESCDADFIPRVSGPVVISWDPVTTSHPELGRPGPVEVVRYQLFVEREGVSLGVDLPPATTTFEVPASITTPGARFKFEIIVRTSTGNNTALESCFTV